MVCYSAVLNVKCVYVLYRQTTIPLAYQDKILENRWLRHKAIQKGEIMAHRTCTFCPYLADVGVPSAKPEVLRMSAGCWTKI